MNDRITNQQLESLVAYLNKLTGNAAEPWSRQADNSLKANIGNYHISGAYGGVCLHQMMNTGGGVDTPLGMGYGTKRELFEALRAFIRGIEIGRHGVTP